MAEASRFKVFEDAVNAGEFVKLGEPKTFTIDRPEEYVENLRDVLTEKSFNGRCCE